MTSFASKAFAVCALGLLLQFPAAGGLYTFSGSFVDNGAGAGVIPDNSIIGLADSHSITSEGSVISSVVLTVQLSGKAIDDLTGYIRLGNTATSPSVSLNSYLTPDHNNFSVNLSTSFQNLNPNTTWTLFFADQSPGLQNTLSGWSLDITAVPEPLNVALGVFGVVVTGVGAARWHLKRRKLHRRPLIRSV